ncbi:hypothetical protein BGX28_000953, partial [Mortierella sp. GBA30]
SWHNSLKSHFFKDRRQRRPDAVVYIMVKSVIPFYQRKCLYGRLNVGRMNAVQKGEMNARMRAETYLIGYRSRGYSGQFVFATEDMAVLKVRSFKDNLFNDVQEPAASTFYDIQLDFEQNDLIGEIVRCSCQAFQRSKTCCKHIALVVIEKEPLKFARCAATWEQTDDAPDGPAQANIPVPVLRIPAASKSEISGHAKSLLKAMDFIRPNSKAQILAEDIAEVRDAAAHIKVAYEKA